MLYHEYEAQLAHAYIPYQEWKKDIYDKEFSLKRICNYDIWIASGGDCSCIFYGAGESGNGKCVRA